MITDIGKKVQTLSVGDAIDAVTKVVVQYGVDASGNPLTKTATAATDNGRTVNLTVSHIAEAMAQTIANNVLSEYTGVIYNSLSASNAELDPACELFDQITVDNIQTAIGSVDTEFNKAMYANIEAQGLNVDDDFPFSTLIERQVQRADTKADTAIAGLADKASKTEAQGYADTAEQNAETAAQGYANTAEQNAKTYASQQASAAQTAAEAAAAIDASTKAQAARTNAKADVDAALAAGTTTISGNCITTGTVNANLITTGTMAADRISGGSLVLGGTDNVNGQLYIQDASNHTIGTWNRTGINVVAGKIAIENPTSEMQQAQYFPLTKNANNEYIVPKAVTKFEAGLETEALADLSAIGISLTRQQFIDIYDVNDDGYISSRDATVILNWYTPLEHLTAYNYDTFRTVSTTYVDPASNKYLAVSNSMYVYSNGVYLAQYDWYLTSITPLGMTIGNYPLATFVTSTGTDNSTADYTWTYHKWTDGKVELWCDRPFTAVSGRNFVYAHLPSFVTNVKNVQASFYVAGEPDGGYTTYLAWQKEGSSSTTYPGQYYIEQYMTLAASTAGKSGVSRYYVLAEWQ